MKPSILGLLVLATAWPVGPADAAAILRAPGPFGDKPATDQSLPGDNLPPFNMLGPDGRLAPPPRREGGGGPPPEAKYSAPGPDLKVALTMAQSAVAHCLKGGFIVGAAVVDGSGRTRAMINADGADGSNGFVAVRKAVTALVFEMPSSQANAAVTSGAAPIAKVTPEMFVMGGGLPLRQNGKVVGAIAVSGAAGAPPGKADEDCAAVGVRAAGGAFQ